jgi:LemA protein
MSGTLGALLLVVAVLAFWAVGAYNRLMRLRNGVLEAFGGVDEQLRARHALLQRLLEWHRAASAPADADASAGLPTPAEAPLQVEANEGAHAGADADAANTNTSAQTAVDSVTALHAATLQVSAAAAVARGHAAAAGAIGSLRLAERILTEARERLHTPDPEPADLGALKRAIGVADSALAYARGRFNDTVIGYNSAAQQFPTRLLAGLFGFRAAATF